MDMDGRFTICNMLVEMGAKCGFMPVDKKTAAWFKGIGVSAGKLRGVRADDDAVYEKVLETDLSALVPQVACPHSVDSAVDVGKLKSTRISEAFLGTCTNGRLADLRIAAKIFSKARVSPSVKCIIAPASRRIMLEALREGLVEVFVKAGCVIVAPGCGPCVGTHNGVPADGENVISTANRNFKGRMGNPSAFIYLASPATVAASAVRGLISDPREFL
jgi:3-isopropylmalate/(R)-2-methylmalate dehydratase large subunit